MAATRGNTDVMSARISAPAASQSGIAITHLIAKTALVVVTLGVLPLAWDASVVWQVLGPLVALAVAAHTVRVVWQAAFSTAPRHLGTSG